MDYSAVKLVFNWLEQYKPFDEIKFDTYTTDRRKKCSINTTFGDNFFLCCLFTVKQLPIL